MIRVVGMGPGSGSRAPGRGLARASAAAPLLAACLLISLFSGGCVQQVRMLKPQERYAIDRAKVEYPPGCDLQRFVVNLTAPTAFAVDSGGNVIIGGGGVGDTSVYLIAFRVDGTLVTLYPNNRDFNLLRPGGFTMHGPIGGILVHDGWIYVSHRDADDMGVITRFTLDGKQQTVVAGLPAQGEHGINHMAVNPASGRFFFGVGSATNSGVPGLDDYLMGWLKQHPRAHDVPWKTVKLLGRRFDTPNPFASLFGGSETVVSAPFQTFGSSNQTTIPGSSSGPQGTPKCNAAIFSISPDGGDLRVEAFGIRNPRGLAFDEYNQLYFTNNGMQLRGSRPVKDDPDAVLKWALNGNYGWPDQTADLHPVTDPHYQPPQAMILPFGYPDLSSVIDREASGFNYLTPGPLLIGGVFPSQSGAAGMVFVRSDSPFKEYAGSAIVALSGDEAPFATGGQKLLGPVGFKVARVDVERGQVYEFIRNTQIKPGSLLGGDADLLERPIDVAFGPDGSLYILDFGRMRVRDGKPAVSGGTGKIYRLLPSKPASKAE